MTLSLFPGEVILQEEFLSVLLLHCDLSLEELNILYTEFYKDHPFTHVSKEPIFLKQVVNTNKAVIQLEKAGNKLVVHSVIDNLLKGACGQAVQNMNLLFGFDETTGLETKSKLFLNLLPNESYSTFIQLMISPL